MRRYVSMAQIAGALVLLAAAAGIAAAQDLWDHGRLSYPELGEIRIPKVEPVRLQNGMVLYILEDHDFPTVRGNLLVRVGGMVDPADKVGLARLTGEVLRSGGSAKTPGDDLDRMLESRGASIEFSIGSSEGNGSLWSLKEDAAKIISLLAELLRAPAFPEDKLELAKTEIRREIAGRNDEPMGIVFREMSEIVYGSDHPYAREPEYATIGAITREDLVAFHKEHFHPDRMYLTLVGDFDAKAMRKTVERYFSDWPASGKAAPTEPPVAVKPAGKLYYAEKTGMTNAWVVAGELGIRADHPDYAAMDVLGEILGGSFSSRLFNEIRTKRGLAYAAGSSPGIDFARRGVFVAFAGTRTDSALVVLDLMRREIKRITEEPVTDAELETARSAILNRDVFKYATKGQIVSRMAYLDFHGYPVDFTARYPEKVRGLTTSLLLEAAKRNIHPETLDFLLVGEQGQFAQPLSSLGAYETIDLTIPEPKASVDAPEATPEALAQGMKLLEKAAAATGGTAAWAKIRSIQQEADLAVTVQGMNLSIALRSVRTADGKDFVSQKLPFGEVVLVRDGQSGWKSTPQGSGDLTPDEISEILEDRARDFWSLFGNPGAYTAQALPPEEVEGRLCDRILISGGGLDQAILYVDAESGEPVQMRYQGQAPQGGPTEVTEVFDDFRAEGPVKVPHSTRTLHNGQPFATGTVKSVSIDGTIDPKLFTRPGS